MVILIGLSHLMMWRLSIKNKISVFNLYFNIIYKKIIFLFFNLFFNIFYKKINFLFFNLFFNIFYKKNKFFLFLINIFYFLVK